MSKLVLLAGVRHSTLSPYCETEQRVAIIQQAAYFPFFKYEETREASQAGGRYAQLQTTATHKPGPLLPVSNSEFWDL